MNKQTTTKSILTNAKSVGQRSLISINKYIRNFLFSLNQGRQPLLYSQLFPLSDTIEDNEDLIHHTQLF